MGSPGGQTELSALCSSPIITDGMIHDSGTANSPLSPEINANWSINAASLLNGECLQIMDNWVANFAGSSVNGFLVLLDQDGIGTTTYKESQN